MGVCEDSLRQESGGAARMSASAGELPPIPSMLVQTFPLDAYLRNLSSQLTDKLNAFHGALVAVRTDVDTGTASIGNIRAFLRQQTLLSIHEKAAEGGITLTDGLALESLLPEFLRDSVTASGVDVGPVAVPLSSHQEGQADGGVRTLHGLVEEINKERAHRLRKEEEEERKVRHQNAEARKRLEQMCSDIEESQKRHLEELQRVTQWLRPVPDVEGDEEGGSGNGNSASWRKRDDIAKLQREMQDTMRSAPLFVEFRRLLLRDLTVRLEEAQDKQSMTLGNAIAGLKGDMKRDLQLKGSRSGNIGGEFGSEMFEGDGEWRLKALDRNYVQRGEITATLRDKADAAVVALKADEAHVRDMEKRLLGRIADLEERMSIYEAERKEFRRILRAVVDSHQRGGGAVPSGTSGGAGDAAVPTGAARGLVQVEEAVDPRWARAGVSPNATEMPSPMRTPPLRGRKPGDGAHSPPSVRRGQKEKHHQQQPMMQQEQQPCEIPLAASATGRLNVAMTVNQEAYANYVTSELNRRTVDALPPLPYERSRHQ